jgi:hypothetical protein
MNKIKRSTQVIGHGLIDSSTGLLLKVEIEQLWELFEQIVYYWNDGDLVKNSPQNFYGQWFEFIELNTKKTPSYLFEYKNAISVLNGLKQIHPRDYFKKLLFSNKLSLYPKRGESETMYPDRATRIGHLKLFVVDEFIDVFLSSGGYKQYGATNYNSFIYQSRFNEF